MEKWESDSAKKKFEDMVAELQRTGLRLLLFAESPRLAPFNGSLDFDHRAPILFRDPEAMSLNPFAFL